MAKVDCDLGSCYLCRHCLPEWKEIIALKKKTLAIKKGKAFFREGDTVEGIYFLYTGAVKVHKTWGPDKELILRFAKAGEVLGYRGLIGTEVYPISATALEDAQACFISSEFLETSLKANLNLVYDLMHMYGYELQRAEKRMRNLAHMEVKGRIADALLQIIQVFGLKRNKEISMQISRQDIASYAGTTYETVFKFFIEQAKNKVLSTSGKAIYVHSLEKLKKLVPEH